MHPAIFVCEKQLGLKIVAPNCFHLALLKKISVLTLKNNWHGSQLIIFLEAFFSRPKGYKKMKLCSNKHTQKITKREMT